MANNYLTPNMNLLVPIPTLETSPNWAYDLNASLTSIDTHNHSTGQGVQITPTGMNINADLPFNDVNSATNLQTVRFTNQNSPLSAASPNLGCLYGSGGNLYWNSGAGNQVQITTGGSVNGSAGTITGLPSGTASATFQSSTGTFQFQQSSGVGASLDAGAVAIRYSGSYPALTGNYILLQAPSTLGSPYSLTLPSASSIPGSGTSALTINSSAQIGSVTYDGIGQGMTAVGANALYSHITNPVSSVSDLVGFSMTSSGTNAIASTMISASCDLIASKMTVTGANTIASTMGSAGANTIAGKIGTSGISSLGIGFELNSSAANNVALGMTTSGANAIINQSTVAIHVDFPPYSYYLIKGLVTNSGTTTDSGFTVALLGGGVYHITFNRPFIGNPPAVTANVINGITPLFAFVTSVTTADCSIVIQEYVGGSFITQFSLFSFIAIG